MVFTIHRYIFRDLLKIFSLTTIAMTVILSLGSIIEPIQEYGIGPEQVVSLLGYSMPITLTFVLPMAALFASTITYGRFTSDNEFAACKASGMSTMTVIYPGLCLAVAVAIANILLSFYVVPSYVKRAEKSIKANAKQIVFRSIDRQGYYEAGKFKLIADAALLDQNKLIGVSIIETKSGKPQSLITCESADVMFDTHSDYNNVTVVAHEAYQIDMQGQAYTKELPVKAKLPSLLEDDIKFQKLEDLKKIKNNPILFAPIHEEANAAFSQIALETLADAIREKIASDSKYYQISNKSRIILLTADNCSTELGEIKLTGNVELYEYDAVFKDELIRKWTCNEGVIRPEYDEPLSTMILTLENAKWKDADGLSGVPTKHNVRNLILPSTIQNKLASDDILSTINSYNDIVKSPSSELTENINKIKRDIVVVFGSIQAEIHFRLVFGIGCIAMILMGTALGIIHKGSHMLTAFGISAIPAAGLIVFIMMGKNLTKNILRNTGEMNMTGIAIMWLGLITLSVICFLTYRKLTRT